MSLERAYGVLTGRGISNRYFDLEMPLFYFYKIFSMISLFCLFFPDFYVFIVQHDFAHTIYHHLPILLIVTRKFGGKCHEFH
jgi:hypothetical protein